MGWIIACQLDYYPSVTYFETYEEAKKEYDAERAPFSDVVYLAEVKEFVSFMQKRHDEQKSVK